MRGRTLGWDSMHCQARARTSISRAEKLMAVLADMLVLVVLLEEFCVCVCVCVCVLEVVM
jgi:hypothetical protein